MTKTYLVVFEKGRQNYSGFAPDVPGCVSVGDTLDEMRINFQEALDLYMETAVELGQPIPEARTQQVTIPLEGESDPHAQYTVDWLTIDIPTTVDVSRRAA